MQREQNLDNFCRTKNWSWSEDDFKGSQILHRIQNSARKQMPNEIYSPFVMTHHNLMRSHRLYPLMRTIPKGTLHHCHMDCCQDKQYYRQFIINDPIIYLTSDLSEFRIGTAEQAQQLAWVSMGQLRSRYQSQDQMVDFVSNITMFNTEDNRRVASKQVKFWGLFQRKIGSFFAILFSLHHFKAYVKYVCQKFLKNGYDRLQFRSMISELNEYDDKGNLVKKHAEKKFTEAIDQICAQLTQNHPNFSLGVIFFGLKMFSAQQNQQIFTKICELNWDKTLGFDLVQEEDAYGSQQSYDEVVSRVLARYPHLNYKKVYHAGQTKDPTNNNIQIAVRAGSVRIGHGINILQRMQILPECKDICFQINHISNILTSLRDDTRISSAPVLMSLGYALTINPDDPGKFGYEDSTVDYFSALISFNWGLKQLKLLGINSINHAVCSEQQKQVLIKSYNKRWTNWIHQLLKTYN